MGVNNYPGTFQEEMKEISVDLDLSKAYIDYLLIITKVNWFNHLEDSELTIQNLKDNRLTCNTKNSFFGKSDMEYLGFWVTRNGIYLINKKV